MTHIRKVQIQTVATVLGVPQVVSNAVVLIAVSAPLLLVWQINSACIRERIPQTQCDPTARSAQLVGQVVSTVFAWMATPPQ